jgi:hypothetical protein
MNDGLVSKNFATLIAMTLILLLAVVDGAVFVVGFRGVLRIGCWDRASDFLE